MPSEEELRGLSESWLRIVTVFLALEIAISTFAYNQFGTIISDFTIYYFTLGMVITMLSALGIFMGSRDPRLQKLSHEKLIDIGVALTASSLVFAAITIGIGTTIIIKDMFLAYSISVGLIATMLIFYPFLYYKFLHTKKD